MVLDNDLQITVKIEDGSKKDALATRDTKKVIKTHRVKSGCFCCRKRKKKCNEARPSCSGCQRNRLKCVYPAYPNQILPKDFVVVKQDIRLSNNMGQTTGAEKRYSLKDSQGLNGKEENMISTPELEKFTDENMEMALISAFPEDIDVLNVARTNQQNISFFNSINDPLSSIQFSKYSQYVPNAQLDDVNSELYFHFVDQFIPSITPSHAHPSVTPKEIWLSLAPQSEILRQVFYCCGASQLAYKYPTYHKLAIEKYNGSVKMIGDAIANRSVDGTEDWLLAAIMMLCLRDRASGFNGSRCAKHLVAAYTILRQREKIKLAALDKIELNGSTEIQTISHDSGFTVSPTERTLAESFLFNYSITLYTCSYDNLILLPSPFHVYKELDPWINSPIFNGAKVSWMNNPVLGSSVKEFEIMSKLVWLLRFHYCVNDNDPHYINEDIFWKAITLLKSDIDNAEAQLCGHTNELDTLSYTESYLRTSISVSVMLFHASKVLFQKLVNPSLSASLPMVQRSVRAILEESQMIPKDDHSMCLCVFGIFIAGAASINMQDKHLIEKLLVDLSDLLYSSFGLNVLGALQKSWEREENEAELENGYKSFDLIFDRDAAEAISF